MAPPSLILISADLEATEHQYQDPQALVEVDIDADIVLEAESGDDAGYSQGKPG